MLPSSLPALSRSRVRASCQATCQRGRAYEGLGHLERNGFLTADLPARLHSRLPLPRPRSPSRWVRTPVLDLLALHASSLRSFLGRGRREIKCLDGLPTLSKKGAEVAVDSPTTILDALIDCSTLRICHAASRRPVATRFNAGLALSGSLHTLDPASLRRILAPSTGGDSM